MCFPSLDATPVKTDYYYILPNGSEIFIAGLDDSTRVEKILGKEYSTIYFNECSQISYESVEVALTRLAEKNSLAKKVYYDANPPSKKHWSYWVFVKHIDPRTSEPLDKSLYASLLMNPADNLDNIDESYITDVLEKLSENQRKRFLLGEFTDDGEGLVYYAFDNERHVAKIDKSYIQGGQHVGMDFNVNPFTGVMCSYVNNTFYIYDELWLENSNTQHASDDLIRRGYRGASIYPDSTGRNRKTSGKSDFVILQENGFNIKDTRNPIVFDRVNNINRLFGLNRIIIDPKCKKLINDLNKVAWAGNDLDKKNDQMLTHISDALGYLCWAIDPMGLKPPTPIKVI